MEHQTKTLDLEAASPWWDDMTVGTCFASRRRTVTETDLVNFVNMSWLTEELFANAGDRSHLPIQGRVVPGALVYMFAEGLTAPSFQAAGMAFLGMTLDVRGPTFVGDTLRVDSEVIEWRATSKPDRGLVRTRNSIINQHGNTVMVYEPLRMMRRRG